MAITRSSSAERVQREKRIGDYATESRNLELSLLVLVSRVLAAGIWLVLRARAPEIEAIEA